MANWQELTFNPGGTITGQHPAERIKSCIDELQKKVVAAIKSQIDEYEFVPAGANTWVFRRKDTSDSLGGKDADKKKDKPIIKTGQITMGTDWGANVRRAGDTYYLDITFPQGDPATHGGDGGGGGGEFYFKVTEITGGHHIEITNTDGTKDGFDVMDGAPGKKGDDGDVGPPPEVSKQSITGGTKIIFTGSNGPVEVDVMNGEKGDDGLITSVDSNATWLSLDPSGQHSLSIQGGNLILTLKTKENNLIVDDGELSVHQEAGSDISVSIGVATCTAFNNGNNGGGS